MKDYQCLLNYCRTTTSLGQLSGLAVWDQETMMPPQGAEQRAEQLSAITQVIHERAQSDEFGELIDRVGAAQLDEVGVANLRLIRRHRERAMAVPPRLVARIAKSTSLATHCWARAKKNEDISLFLPSLKEIVSLKREEARALARDGNPYDALLEAFEPDVPSQWIEQTFARLRSQIVRLRDRILAAEPLQQRRLNGLSEARQLELAGQLADCFGYNRECGRLDISAHPFTCGERQDVRITTRIDPSDILDCLYSTIHETGHAVYEQNINSNFAMMPVGNAASLGIHESQSRFCENQIARSRPFSEWLGNHLRKNIGAGGFDDTQIVYEIGNQVKAGYIRTKADEVQYNLHIMMRFDLEKQLITGELEVSDLEEAWNARFESDFGLVVKKPSEGVLQDIHWASGSFGYFPTYTLGNIYSGCLHAALLQDIPDLDKQLSAGCPMEAVKWMTEKVHRFGALFKPLDLIRQATFNDEVTEAPLVDYLEHKFGELYGL